MQTLKILNELGRNKEPFFFIIDFEVNNLLILKQDEHDCSIAFDINGIKSKYQPSIVDTPSLVNILPISFDEYNSKFKLLQEKISSGDTYLANLTSKTKIELSSDLANIYANANAPFKVWLNGKFVSFSPERFVRIKNNEICTMPMKGTANIDCLEELLQSEKEKAEHTMSVDLLRNDISQVAKSVKLKKYRDATLINAGSKKVWQTSSEIIGLLDENWQENLGDIFQKLLPAGSISGTPKKMTVKILKEIEGFDRDFFTGVFGYFGGDFLDSAVAIRFIEQYGDGFFYKSGGGITEASSAIDEYNEMLTKIYIPL